MGVLEARAKWKGYNYTATGLKQGEIYDITYSIKSPTEIVVGYESQGKEYSVTYTSLGSFNTAWQVQKK